MLAFDDRVLAGVRRSTRDVQEGLNACAIVRGLCS
jgi:hypothetical protein